MNVQIKLILLFCSILINQAFAQNNKKGEPVQISIIYEFTHQNDLNNPTKPHIEEMILRLGTTESRYSSWTDEVNNKKPIRTAPSSSSNGSGGEGSFGYVPSVMVDDKGIRDFDLLQLPTKNKLVRILRLGNNSYMIESELPKINWKVQNEKREIGGYACQKAIGEYAGRNYSAWFTQELPYQNGPWKLSGLPGLIMEASDQTGQVSFKFKEIKKGLPNESTAARNTRIIAVNQNTFEKAAIAFEKDPTAVAQSQGPIGGARPILLFKDSEGVIHDGINGEKLYERYLKKIKARKSNPLELKKPTS